MTYANVDELLNAIYYVFGSGVTVDQWGSYFAPQQVQREPVTVVVSRTERVPSTEQPELWDH